MFKQGRGGSRGWCGDKGVKKKGTRKDRHKCPSSRSVEEKVTRDQQLQATRKERQDLHNRDINRKKAKGLKWKGGREFGYREREPRCRRLGIGPEKTP